MTKRFVVYKLARNGVGYHTLRRFTKREAARAFAQVESIKRESTIYVDEELGKGKGEPIATFTSGMSVRI